WRDSRAFQLTSAIAPRRPGPASLVNAMSSTSTMTRARTRSPSGFSSATARRTSSDKWSPSAGEGTYAPVAGHASRAAAGPGGGMIAVRVLALTSVLLAVIVVLEGMTVRRARAEVQQVRAERDPGRAEMVASWTRESIDDVDGAIRWLDG